MQRAKESMEQYHKFNSNIKVICKKTAGSGSVILSASITPWLWKKSSLGSPLKTMRSFFSHQPKTKEYQKFQG